jgi:hypothetical protein
MKTKNVMKDVKTKSDGKIINSDIENLKLVPYKEFGPKFAKELKLHKMFVSEFLRDQDIKIIGAIISSGEELALVYSEFKCEKCRIEDDLQFHHLIQKNIRGYINDTKYIIQRYYWSNISVLCNKCHAKFHGFDVKRFVKDSLCIQKQKVNKVKELYNLNKKDEIVK